MYDLRGKTILLTGGAGFLGRQVYQELSKLSPQSIIVPRSSNCNLLERSNIQKLFNEFHPEVVVHLAARVGGIKANRENPGKFFYENAMMGIQLMEEARLQGVEKMLTVGTICAYPKFTPTPFSENDLWMGYPEETNAPYGLAKKMLLVQSQAYRVQYQFPGIFILPTNLYGPWDNFDLDSSHVIPALIRKAHEAKQANLQQVTLWGTGQPTREFLYVEEAARGLVLALQKYDGGDPVNLGSGDEISIAELAAMIFNKVGFKGNLVWDASMPDGQPKRCVSTNRAWEHFGFKNQVRLSDGLDKTIDWFKSTLR